MRRRFASGIALLGASFLVASACSSDTAEEQKRLAELAQGCLINSDCASPLVCVFRKCHEECQDSRDCDPGQLCVTTDVEGLRVCQLPAETKCRESQDCQGKQICGPDGRCRDQCSAIADCGPEQVCANDNACAEKDEVDPNNDIIVEDAGVDGSAGSSGSGGSAGAGGSAGSGGAGGSSGSAGSGGDASVDSGQDASTCPQGFGDCDTNPADCETALNQLTSCGSCTTSCVAPNAVMACAATLSCAITGCQVGFGNCDGQIANGCETDVNTSAAHCGKCGRSCGSGTCTAGQCSAAPIGTFTGSSPRAVIGPNHVYILTEASGAYTLQRVAKDGSGTEVVDTVSANAGGFAIDGGFIYVARSTDGIERYDALSGQADPTWGATTPAMAEQLTVKGTAFYWSASNATTYTAPKATGVPSLPLGSISAQSALTSIAVTNTGVYLTTNNSAAAVAGPITGGPMEILTLPSVGGYRLVTSGDAAYFAVNNHGVFAHVFDPQKSAQDPPTLLHPQAISFTGLATDGTSLIYTRSSNASIYSAPLAGGNVAVLGTVTSVAGVLGVDSSFVYLYAGTTVHQLAK